MNIYEKMLKATEKISTVAKNLEVGVGKSKYKAVGEADVLQAVKPIEIELGIYSYPYSRKVVKDSEVTTRSDYNGEVKEKISVFMRVETVYRFVNIEKPEEYVDIMTYGDGVDSQDKAPGKAMTYADKYALLKAYKIITGDDPDQFKSEDMYKSSNNFNSVKKDWTFSSGRFKGLTMIEASERADFFEYINMLKQTNHFTKEIEEEYNKANKIAGFENILKEVEI